MAATTREELDKEEIAVALEAYKKSTLEYKKECEKIDVDVERRKELWMTVTKTGLDLFIKSGIPEELAQQLVKGDFSKEALIDFKASVNKYVKEQREVIRAKESELYAEESKYFDLNQISVDIAKRPQVIAKLRDEIDVEKAKLAPLLDTATAMAGHTTLRSVITGMSKLVLGFCGFIAGGLWILGNALLTGTSNIISSKLSFGEPTTTTAVNGSVGAVNGLLKALSSAHVVNMLVANADERVDATMTNKSLNNVLNTFIGIAENKYINAADTKVDADPVRQRNREHLHYYSKNHKDYKGINTVIYPEQQVSKDKEHKEKVWKSPFSTKPKPNGVL